MNDQDMARLWRKLTDNQRRFVANLTLPSAERPGFSHFIVAMRALDRLGLSRDADRRKLGEWAREHGFARQDGPLQRGDHYPRRLVASWVVSEPPRPYSRIDPARLAELVAEGAYGAEIAKALGVTREAVRQAVQRHGLTLPRKPTKPKPPRPPRVLRPRRLGFTVSADESAAIQRAAARRGLTVSAYLRGLCAADEAEPPA